jgi:sulfatase maturation enzyme AslB (radical SAM superfamily)
VLRDLFDLLAAGAFVHSPNQDEDCRFCEFGRACGPGAAAGAQAKIDNGANDTLEAYRRLRAHE